MPASCGQSCVGPNGLVSSCPQREGRPRSPGHRGVTAALSPGDRAHPAGSPPIQCEQGHPSPWTGCSERGRIEGPLRCSETLLKPPVGEGILGVQGKGEKWGCCLGQGPHPKPSVKGPLPSCSWWPGRLAVQQTHPPLLSAGMTAGSRQPHWTTFPSTLCREAAM